MCKLSITFCFLLFFAFGLNSPFGFHFSPSFSSFAQFKLRIKRKKQKKKNSKFPTKPILPLAHFILCMCVCFFFLFACAFYIYLKWSADVKNGFNNQKFCFSYRRFKVRKQKMPMMNKKEMVFPRYFQLDIISFKFPYAWMMGVCGYRFVSVR